MYFFPLAAIYQTLTTIQFAGTLPKPKVQYRSMVALKEHMTFYFVTYMVTLRFTLRRVCLGFLDGDRYGSKMSYPAAHHNNRQG